MNALIKRLFFVSGLVLALLVAIESAIAGPIGFSVSSEGDDHLYQIDLLTGFATDLGQVRVSDAEGLAFVGSQLYAIGTGTSISPPISSELDSLISLTERDEGINEYDSTVSDRD